MSLAISSLGEHLQVTAEEDFLSFRCDPTYNLRSMQGWPHDSLDRDGGKATAIELEQLLEQGFAEARDGGVRIPYAGFPELRRLDYRCITRWTQWSPFMISIAPTGDLGRPGFHYRYTFRLGATRVSLQRAGYFVQRHGRNEAYHLDDQTFALVEAMDRYNALPLERRTDRENWLSFAIIQHCAQTVGAALDQLLKSNEVVVPSRVGVHIIEHEDESISFVPRCSGVSEDGMKNAFLARPQAEGIYSVDREDGGRLRVVLDDEQQEVLRRMKALQRLQGASKQEALQNPGRYFDGLLGRIDLPYGRRVEGVGNFPFAAAPRAGTARSGIFDGTERVVPVDPDVTSGDLAGEGGERPAVIHCATTGGQRIRLQLDSSAASEELRGMVLNGLAAGETSVLYNGLDLAIDSQLASDLGGDPVDRTKSALSRQGKYLLIYTDEEELKPWDEIPIGRLTNRTDGSPSGSLPLALRPEVSLKSHQISGVKWLQHCTLLRPDRRGCLLADDMGLGKTLQVLAYLAWAIEQKKIVAAGGNNETGPWRPILIIAPLVLLETGTWRAEMERFFAHSGSVFEPVKVLHGATIAEFRNPDEPRELRAGVPTLSAPKLMRYRVIITNYETVKNFQHSFAQTVQGTPLWSIVVTDEAHEYKTPNTKVAHAIKALQPDFHVACTGTPVENRLLDLWNVMDTLQPALLGTAKEFSEQYEADIARRASGEIQSLRERLLFGAPNAFVLRRDKRMLADLPEKREHRLYSDMTPQETRLHLGLIGGSGRSSRSKVHLQVLHRLSALYQHPSLFDESWDRKSAKVLLSESAKLRSVVQQLHKIRERSEKALIFARLVNIQQLLAVVLRAEFQLNVQIINGATPRAGQEQTSAHTRRATETRSHLLQEFRSRPGFNVLILSPFVAGVGLTLTEANHVFHYGRWWNPAVESQATDRAYRIGQEKPVSVYLPILRDPEGRVQKTFDECLDDLLVRRATLAQDFLQPQHAEDSLASELGEDLAGGVRDRGMVLDKEAIQRLLPEEFEALVACLYAHDGYRIVLTSLSCDGGADVVAVKPDHVVLVQAKHSGSGNSVERGAVADLLAASNIYRSSILRPIRLHLATNTQFDTACLGEASRHGVQLVTGARFNEAVIRAEITLGDVVSANSERASSFDDGLRKVKRML